MALLDAIGHGSGLVSTSDVLATQFDAISVGVNGTLTYTSAPSQFCPYYLQASTGGSSVVAYGERVWDADQATFCLVIYVYFAAVPSAVTSFASVLDSANNGICDLRVNASGNWALYNYGDATLYTSTGKIILASQWYRIEVKMFCDNAAGTIDWKTNGKLEPGINGLTSKDTLNVGTARKYRIGVTVAQANAGARRFGACMAATDWLGRTYIVTLRPASNDAGGDNWTLIDGSSTEGWQALDDVPWASATTDLVHSSTANQEERVKFNKLAQTDTGVTFLGVIPYVRVNRQVAGSAAGVVLDITSGASHGTTKACDPSGTTFTTFRGALQTTDPATGVAWTLASLNALILRMVHDAGTNRINMNAAMIEIILSCTSAIALDLENLGARGAHALRLARILGRTSETIYITDENYVYRSRITTRLTEGR